MKTPAKAVWENTDRYRVFAWLSGAGLAAAAALGAFGLPPVGLHSPLREFGMVCPLCGGTRAMAALMHGDLAGAWHYNPIAFVVVLGALGFVARLVLGLITGRWLRIAVTQPVAVYGGGAVLLAGLWVNQAAHAPLLLAEQQVPGATGRSLALAVAGGSALLVAVFMAAVRSSRPHTHRDDAPDRMG